MRPSHRLLVLAAMTSVATLGTARASSPADLFIRMQTGPPGMLIQHCKATAPETHDELVAEFETFKGKFAEAAAPLVAEMPPDVSPDIAASLERLIAETGERQLQAVRQLDPHAYCSWLLKSLRAATTEKLRATIQGAFERYTELAKGKPQKPVKP